MKRPLAAIVAFGLGALAPAEARARDGDDRVLDAPAPPTLPALTHRDLTYTFELTAASIQPNGSKSPIAPASAYAWFVHSDLEVPLEARKWYVGIAQDVADAAVPHVGSIPAASGYVLGNPELWIRGVWSSVLGLSSGGTLGVVLPVPRDLSDAQSNVLRTVRTVRPWDVAYFDDLTLTFRPSFDIRHVVGPVMLQLRQGIDWSIPLRKTRANESGQDLVARTTFYVGYRVAQPIGLGLEVWEIYQLTSDIIDDKRAAFAISPSVRLILGRVQPALSLLMPIATPLRGDVDSYYALRLNVAFSFDMVKGTLSTGP